MNNTTLGRREFLRRAGMGIATAAFAGAGAAGIAPARAADAAVPAATLLPRPFGKGIFGHVFHGGRLRERGESIAALTKNPHIAGTQLSYSWVQLEPRPGEYRWDLIEGHIELWARAGKKCWIEVATASKRDTQERGDSRGAPL